MNPLFKTTTMAAAVLATAAAMPAAAIDIAPVETVKHTHGFPMTLGRHVFDHNGRGEMLHFVEGELRAIVPADGLDAYTKAHPEAQPVVDQLQKAAKEEAARLAAEAQRQAAEREAEIKARVDSQVQQAIAAALAQHQAGVDAQVQAAVAAALAKATPAAAQTTQTVIAPPLA